MFISDVATVCQRSGSRRRGRSRRKREKEEREKVKEKEKINDLVLDRIRQRYDGELERSNNLDDEARQLVGSILVVVGFLLGAGVINFLSISRPSFSALYFVGVIVLVGSIVSVYKAIRLKFVFYHVAEDPKRMLENDPDTALRDKMVDPDLIPYLEIVRSHI